MSAGKIRVVLVDDHGVVRAGLKAVFAQWTDMEIVGEADDGKSALELLMDLKPDVALVDLTMQNVGGRRLAEEVRAAKLCTRVIALTMHDEQERMHALRRAGAAGYVLKSAPTEVVREAILAVMSGGQFFPGLVDAPLEELTVRETEVAIYVAKGLRDAEIASMLNVSVRTVESHKESIRRKWGIETVAELAVGAIARGLLEG